MKFDSLSADAVGQFDFAGNKAGIPSLAPLTPWRKDRVAMSRAAAMLAFAAGLLVAALGAGGGRAGADPTDRRASRHGHEGDWLRPLRSAQAVALHQNGIGGRGHPIQRFRFPPGPSQNSALCIARTDCGLGGRVHAAFMLGVVLSEKLRGRTDASRAFGGRKKGATTRLTAPAYWKFESISLQRLCAKKTPLHEKAKLCTKKPNDLRDFGEQRSAHRRTRRGGAVMNPSIESLRAALGKQAARPRRRVRRELHPAIRAQAPQDRAEREPLLKVLDITAAEFVARFTVQIDRRLTIKPRRRFRPAA